MRTQGSVSLDKEKSSDNYFTYTAPKGLGFHKDGSLNIAWLAVDGASKYEVYVAKYNDRTRKASGWRLEKKIRASMDQKIVKVSLKKYKKKPFKKRTWYVYKVVTYATRGGKSQDSLTSCAYIYDVHKELSSWKYGRKPKYKKVYERSLQPIPH